MEHTEPAHPKEDSQRLHKKRNVFIDVAVILVVLIVIGIVWWIGHRPKPEVVSKVPQYSDQQLVTEVNKKYGANDYLGAINLIKGQKRVDEIAVQSLLAAAYANAGDTTKALEVYEKLDQKGQLSTFDTASAADVAERAKQYQKSIDFYKKAKERLKGSPADSADQAAVYDYKITELEKKL